MTENGTVSPQNDLKGYFASKDHVRRNNPEEKGRNYD